jgi:hypothetical protein
LDMSLKPRLAAQSWDSRITFPFSAITTNVGENWNECYEFKNTFTENARCYAENWWKSHKKL